MKTLCPFCFEEYDVDASSMFQEATCLKCDKKFFVQPAKKCKACGVYYDAAKVTCRNCGAVDSAEIESTAELRGQKYTDTGNGEEIFQKQDEKALGEKIRRYKFFNVMYRICRITTLFFWVLSVVLVLMHFNNIGLAILSLFISILPLAGMLIFRRARDTAEIESIAELHGQKYTDTGNGEEIFQETEKKSFGGSSRSLVGLVIVGIILILVASCVSFAINTREEKRIRQEELDKKWQEVENRRRQEESERQRQEAEWRRQEAERQRQENDRKCRELEENTRRWQEAERQRQEAEQQKRREGRELEENNQKWQEAKPRLRRTAGK